MVSINSGAPRVGDGVREYKLNSAGKIKVSGRKLANARLTITIDPSGPLPDGQGTVPGSLVDWERDVTISPGSHVLQVTSGGKTIRQAISVVT
jgi:hypothetical protein